VSIWDDSRSGFIGSGAVNHCQTRSRMIYRHVTALVVASAHIAIACHLLAALHFGWGHQVSLGSSDAQFTITLRRREDSSYNITNEEYTFGMCFSGGLALPL